MVGICEVPDYAWYSHDTDGSEIEPYHRYAISILVDQGYETMEGASGDDWISGAQSMRAYMRAQLIGGVVGAQFGVRGHARLASLGADHGLEDLVGADQLLGLRCIHTEALHCHQAVLTDQLGQDGTHGRAIDLFIDLLGVIPRHCGKGLAAPAPQRAANCTSTGASRPLLAERLGATATHGGAALLADGAGTAGGHVRGYHLVHQRLVELAAEGRVGNLDGAATTLYL